MIKLIVFFFVLLWLGAFCLDRVLSGKMVPVLWMRSGLGSELFIFFRVDLLVEGWLLLFECSLVSNFSLFLWVVLFYFRATL